MRPNDERLLDLTHGVVRRLLVWATENQYEAIQTKKPEATLTYWDGYIRALNHLLEAEQQ